MKVIGYAFDADTFCVDCTKQYIIGSRVTQAVPHPDQVERWMNGEDTFLDSENNPIHAIFDTDESGDTPGHCGNCMAYIDTSWTSECASYAVEALQEYVNASMRGVLSGSPEVLDEWEESLQWVHGLEHREELIIELYKAVREHERTHA